MKLCYLGHRYWLDHRFLFSSWWSLTSHSVCEPRVCIAATDITQGLYETPLGTQSNYEPNQSSGLDCSNCPCIRLHTRTRTHLVYFRSFHLKRYSDMVTAPAVTAQNFFYDRLLLPCRVMLVYSGIVIENGPCCRNLCIRCFNTVTHSAQVRICTCACTGLYAIVCT